MAYNEKNLSVLSHANGFTLWHYRTADTATDTETVGYFNGAADMLCVDDMILANLDIDSANPGVGIFLVSYNDGVVVDIANLIQAGR